MGTVKSVPYLFGVLKFDTHKQRKEIFILGKKIICENQKIFSQNYSLQAKLIELTKSSDAKMMM